MALQLRRGLEADRLGITPAVGEPIVTEQLKLYIGDGSTPGGFLISGGDTSLVSDTSPQLGGNLDVHGHSIVSTNNGNITLAPDGTGTVLLGGNLDVGGKKIVSSSNGNIEIDAGGTGDIILQNYLTINEFGDITKTGQLNISPTTLLSIGINSSLVDGNVYVTRNAYSNSFAQGFTFAQHHTTPDAVNFTLYRSRGTGTAPAAVVNGDDLADISFLGHDGTNRASGAAISATVEGTPSAGHVPTKLSFATDNGTTLAVRAELSSFGELKVNTLQNYSGSDIEIAGTGVITATNAIIGDGAASPSAGSILTILGTMTGGSLAVTSLLSGGTIASGTSITTVNSATFTSTISTTTMTVSNVASGTITVGMALSGGAVTAGTYVVAFVSGVNGGAGTYTLNQSATGTPTTGTSYTVNTSQLVASTTITSGGNVNLIGNVKIFSQHSLRFADSDSSNFVAFKGPAIVGSNITWTLPANTGVAGEVLTAGSSGVLSWSVPLAGAAPLAANSAGIAGQIAFDATHIYVCVATATWVRATLATWP